MNASASTDERWSVVYISHLKIPQWPLKFANYRTLWMWNEAFLVTWPFHHAKLTHLANNVNVMDWFSINKLTTESNRIRPKLRDSINQSIRTLVRGLIFNILVVPTPIKFSQNKDDHSLIQYYGSIVIYFESKNNYLILQVSLSWGWYDARWLPTILHSSGISDARISFARTNWQIAKKYTPMLLVSFTYQKNQIKW